MSPDVPHDPAVVRRATAADVVALVELRAEMFAAMGVTEQQPEWRRHADQWFRDRLHHPAHRIVVVEVAGEVVACAMGAIRDAAPSPTVPAGRDVLISNVCTRSAHRRHGHGRAAFQSVLAWARKTGVERAELLATRSGASMYRAAGFEVSDHPLLRAPLG